MKKYLLMLALVLSACLNNSDEDKPPTIEPGEYSTTATIEGTLMTFYFDFESNGNLQVEVHAQGQLLSLETGAWEMVGDKLCFDAGELDGCDDVRNITPTSFEIYDDEENSWRVFSK